MGSRKSIFAVAVQLLLESCSVLSQCVQVPQTCGVSTYSSVQPVTQFVIPAVIKPLIQETSVQNAPCVPSYSDIGGPGFGGPGFGGPGYGFPGPYGGMPPIIYNDDGDSNQNWLYWLILLMSRRCGGGFGGGYGGFGGGCGGGCGGSCGGGCGGNCGGGCGGGFGGNCGGGCGSYCGGGCGGNCGSGCGGSCGGNYGGYGNCGSGCGSGCGNCGSCGGFNGNGYGCNYIPYPMPCGCFYDNNNEYDCGCGGCYPANEQRTPEINLIVKTADSCAA